MRLDFRQCRQAATVPFDGNDLFRPERKYSAGEAAGTGPDLNDSHAFERSRRSGDLLGKVEVEQEVLSERFLRIEPMTLDDIP